jgi:SSS family solute:Na+ symporter
MAVATNLTPTFALSIGGFTFPGYTAFFTVILNLVVAIVLTPVFNTLRGGAAPVDATTEADYVLPPA